MGKASCNASFDQHLEGLLSHYILVEPPRARRNIHCYGKWKPIVARKFDHDVSIRPSDARLPARTGKVQEKK